MDIRDIQIFLSVCKTRNISETAIEVFLTQSAVTQRIAKLEEYLGFPLLLRGRGRRGIEISPQGELFLPVAEQWKHLDCAAKAIKNGRNQISLSFGGIDSVNTYLLQDFFSRYILQNPSVSLDIYTHNSWEIYHLVEMGEIDAGLAHSSGIRISRNILVEPLFTEPYVVLLPPNHDIAVRGSWVDPADLSPENEVFPVFDNSLRQWHERFWPCTEPRIYIQGSVSLIIPPLVNNPASWSIVPVSVARSISTQHPVLWYPISGHTLERTCYFARRKQLNSYKAEVIAHFRHALMEDIFPNYDYFKRSNHV